MSPGILAQPEDTAMEDVSSPAAGQEQPSSPQPLPVGDVPSDSSDKENRKTALEDMFDDDDDDAFMSSLAQTEGTSSQVVAYVFLQVSKDMPLTRRTDRPALQRVTRIPTSCEHSTSDSSHSDTCFSG
jgi:hypothetical protein